MSNADLYLKINALPEDVRKQVIQFIDRLMRNQKKSSHDLQKRPLGLLKGKIRISDDFDAPLDDMKEYME